MMLLALTLRSSVMLVVALALCRLARRRSAARRHLVLSAGVAAALAVGPLSWVVPGVGLTPGAAVHEAAVLPIDDVRLGDPAASAAAPAASRWPEWLLVAWAIGIAVRGGWLGLSFVRLRRQTKRGTPPGGDWARGLPVAAAELGTRARVRVLVSAAIEAPVSWGWRRPVILLPLAATLWSGERVRMVLLHELAHIRRWDWPLQMAGELLAILYWFNPLVFVVRRRLRRESEQACDDLVLASGIRPDAYAMELAALARHHPGLLPAGAVPMAQPSSLERRITAMLDPTLDRRAPTRRTVVVCCALALIVTIPAAVLRLLAQDESRTFTVQVFDPSGAVLPGVSLDLEDAQLGTRSTSTEGSGRALLDGVAPGDYTISAALPGFRSLRAPVSIRVARDRQRSITLQVAELQETVTVRERRPAPRATPASGAVVEPLRVGGNIRVPRKLTHVAPVYPPAMRDAGLEGIVPLEALIGRDGTVASVRLLSADVHPEFARAATDAVSGWLFSPTLLNGEAVEVRMAVSVRFSLED